MEGFILTGAIFLIIVVIILFSIREALQGKQIEHAKTEFVSLISHELRTPPSTIKWYSEMLLRDEQETLTDDQKRYIRQIATSAQQMITLTNALLNISRLEMGSFAIEPEVLDIVKISKQTVEEFKPQITEKKLQVTENYEANLPQITNDPKFIALILRNILINAINYTASNGQINVSIAKEGKAIKIAIQDTGCGIPHMQQAKVFTKLFRADNARMIERKGNGLGLYLVKFLTQKMKGKVWFTSEENKGSTFYVLLPQVSPQKKREGMRLD